MTSRSAVEIVRDRLTGDSPAAVRIGAPERVGGLSLFPLFGNGEHVGYELFTKMREAGSAEVGEVGIQGQVPSLEVRNLGQTPILFLDGEILIGLKQNRVLDTSILVPPKTSITIPVACVEARRWNRSTAKASVSRHAVSPMIRAAKMASLSASLRGQGGYNADQRMIWDRVDATLQSHRVKSRTASYTDIEKRRVAEIDRLLHQLRPQDRQVGVLAFVGDAPLSLDLFDQPGTLASAWVELVGSYVMEAMVSRQDSGATTETAAEWVREVVTGEATSHRGVGMGETVLITNDQHSLSALVAEGVAVHIAAWPSRWKS